MVLTVVPGINRALHTGIPGTFDDSPRMTVRVVGLPRPPSALKGIGRSIDAVCNRHYFSFRRDFSLSAATFYKGYRATTRLR